MSDGLSILIVDDEQNVLESLSRLLRKEQYAILTTVHIQEALDILEKQEIAVVISDQKMPEMSGTSFLKKVQDSSPDTIKILITGYQDIDIVIEAINEGSVWHYFNKPWNDEEIKQTVRKAISQYQLMKENKHLQEITIDQNRELKDLNNNLEEKVKERTKEIIELNKSLSKKYMDTINVLAHITELNNSLVGNHSKRVAEWVKQAGTYLEIDEKELNDIEVAALLHDIGKIGMPKEILEKSVEDYHYKEFEIYQKHVLKGESIANLISDQGEVARYIRHHHERFDGEGFPDKLKGDEIPLGSVLISLADIYDNILNVKKTYRSTSSDGVIKIIQKKIRTYFDPEIATAFIVGVVQTQTQTSKITEIGLKVDDLKEDMKLSRDIVTPGGIVIVPKESILTQKEINKIKYYHQVSFLNEIFIYR